MPINKISGLVNLPAPPVPIALPGGATFMLPAGQGIVGAFGSLATPQLGTGYTLSGQYFVELGLYSTLQVYDSNLNYWRNILVQPGQLNQVSSDGTNFRIANTTGCPVAGLITALGSGGIAGFYGFNNQGQAITIQGGVTTLGNTIFTIAPTAGGSQWNSIVGGSVNTTMALSGTAYANLAGYYVAGAPSFTATGGTNYTKPPIIIFTPPPNQGAQPCILPTAVCTISAGAINAVTVTHNGSGLLGLPGVVVIPQPGDTTGAGALLGWTAGNGVDPNAGKLTAMWPMFYGTPLSAVPTFTYSGTNSPAPTVTAIMNFSVTSITNTTPGVGYTSAYALFGGGIVAGNSAMGNPFYDKGLSLPVFPPLSVVAGTGVCTLAGPFGGVNIQAVPTIALGTQLAAGTVTTVAVQTPVVGGSNDMILISSL